MKYFLILSVILFLSCKENENKQTDLSDVSVTTSIEAEDIKLEIHDFNGLEKYLNFKNEKTYVVNFWATWCAPCVKELPHFEELYKNYKTNDVEVILVSLDFPKQYDKKLKPFIAKHNLQSKILVLDDVDMNSWIPKVNKDWDGAIPVTIIYNKDNRQFYDQPFTYEQLETELNKFIN